jgi:hypothetical protein
MSQIRAYSVWTRNGPLIAAITSMSDEGTAAVP